MSDAEQQSLGSVGRYELVRKIATGGMAELFLAKFSGPGGFEKRCALKRILPQFVGDDDFKRMFMNEARVAAMFEHPNLVQIFELGQDDTTKQFYIAMELINGMDLRQLANLARQAGTLIPPELAGWMMSQALDGLAYAHEFKDASGTPLNLVHRDISPQNILVSYEGALKVVDFGIVKATSNEGQTVTGTLKGKIAYMSPEQAVADKLDARSDLFAIGICLYELITGVKPFRGKNEVMTLKAILDSDPTPLTELVPDCPHGIERAVYRALAKRRDDRYQTAREMQVDLMSVLRHTPLPLERRMLAEFIRSLTEKGTDRFDATKLKIPRTNDPNELSSGGVRFAGSAVAPAPFQPGQQQMADPRMASSMAGGYPSFPPQRAGEQSISGVNPGFHQGMAGEGSVSGVNPAFNQQQMLAAQSHPHGASPFVQPGVGGATHPGVNTGTDIGAERRAAIGGRAPLFAVIAFIAAAIVATVAWFLRDPGSATVAQLPPERPGTAQKKSDPPPRPDPPKQDPPTPGTAAVPADPGATTAAAAPTPGTTPTAPGTPTPTPGSTPKTGPATPAPSVPGIAAGGKLTLNSKPRGLSVYLDGNRIGSTPLSDVAMPVGTHELTLSSGRLGVRKRMTVTIKAGELTKSALTVGRGTVIVRSRPWSEVSIDGRVVGKTPLQRPIYEGRHTVKLKTESGAEQTRTVTVKRGQEKKILVKF